jgi:hypothetical protein
VTREIGFILLTHEKPTQVVRLVRRLNSMFSEPPIVCHHDFSQSDFAGLDVPRNVRFVSPHIATRWARFPVVEATIRCLGRLYSEGGGPRWFVVLSGTDYPVKSADVVLRDLNAGGYDAHLDIIPVRYEGRTSAWEELCYKRYLTITIAVPGLVRKLGTSRQVVRLKHPTINRMLIPCWRELDCFAGSQWFCGNRNTAEAVLEFHAARPALARHYSRLMFPEESYFQTILGNTAGLKLNPNNWRYVDWSDQQAHPRTLGMEDLSKLMSSDAHFARKFDPRYDARVLAALDEITS